MPLNPLLLVLMSVGLCSANAATTTFGAVSDDFDRDKTFPEDSGTEPNPIGTQYTVASGTWEISRYLLQATDGGVMYENTLQTKNTGGFSFTLQADNLFSGTVQGLVFNLQDASNYYVLRYTRNPQTTLATIEFLVVVNGVARKLDSSTGLDLVSTAYYTMTVSSSPTQANTFTFSISDIGSPTPIYTNTVTDATFTDGYSGFFRVGGTARWDNYSLTVLQGVPEHSPSKKASR